MRRRRTGLMAGALFVATLSVGDVAAGFEPEPSEPTFPDLVVQSLTGPGPLFEGQVGTVSVTVANEGLASARSFTVAIYKHRPAAPELGTPGDVNCTVRSLWPGRTATCTGSVSYAAAGTYSLWAQVDVHNQVVEDGESNNVEGPQPVTAAPPPLLSVTQTGSGMGTVSSNPAGVACGSDCAERYVPGTVVALTATPALGSVFGGWSGGGCSGEAGCTVTVDRDLAVTATFHFTIPLSFARARTFGVGAGPAFVAVGHFDGDGRLDLVVANYSGHSVSVLLGDGTGSFGAATHIAVGVQPVAVAVGDVNGDGRLDLAVANQASHTVSILLGDGAGGFGAAAHIAVGSGPRSVAVGDLNGDGRLDLAVANHWGNSVSILLGDGVGGFGAPTQIAVGWGPRSVAVGDVNGDGRLDLAVANGGSNTVAILLGNGTGGFGAATYMAAADMPYALSLDDVDGDGRLDLAVASTRSNTIAILLGNGTGGFGVATHFAVGAGPTSVALGEFNLDGNLDLAVANYSGHSVSVLPGVGTGAFAGGPATTFPAGRSPHSVAIGDFNGDGKPDLAVANETDDTVWILLNTTLEPPV
jgi:hypothetical protein